jgi:hypothetical protein
MEDGTSISAPNHPCTEECTFRDMEMLPGIPVGARVPRSWQVQPVAGSTMIFVVRADYEDTFRKPHETVFCLIEDLSGDMRGCPGVKNIAT